MTLHNWAKNRAVYGYPTFSIEDVRKAKLFASENVLQNELSRLCKNKVLANVYRGFYVYYPIQYMLRGAIPASYYMDQLMNYLQKPYYVCLLSAAEMLGSAHQRPQEFSVMTILPVRRYQSKRNVKVSWIYRDKIPESCIFTKNTETGTIRISNALLTAADLIQYQQHVGGLSRAATVLGEMVDQLEIERDFKLLQPYVKNVVWQRLGFILDQVLEDKKHADQLYDQLPLSRIRYTLLSNAAQNVKQVRDKRWKVFVNIKIEVDEL